MKNKERTTITIKTPIWTRLVQLKLDWGLRYFDDVIEHLLDLTKTEKEVKEENGTGHISDESSDNGFPKVGLPDYGI